MKSCACLQSNCARDNRPPPCQRVQQCLLDQKDDDKFLTDVATVSQKKYDCNASCEYIFAYHRKQFSISSTQRILDAVCTFTPKCKSIIEQIGPEGYNRSEAFLFTLLLESERVMAHSTTPCCVLRRSGEILKCNRTFLNMIGLTIAEMTDLRFFELLTEEACVNFWERIIPMYKEGKDGGMIIPLVFRKRLGDERIECTASFFIRNDSNHLPVLIMATIIPS